MSEKLVAALTPGVDDTTNEDPLKKPIILVHGKPGVGKTTQSERIAKYTGLPLISLELIMARVTMTGGSSSSSSDGATPFNEEELSEAMRTLYADIRLQLVNGAEVAPEQVYRLVKDCLNGEDVVAKGMSYAWQ